MSKGPAFYYASDKNILDAINQSRVDSDTIQAMLRRRNIVCSKQTQRLELAKFFSRLTHDLRDHTDLSNRLGMIARRERVTAVDLKGTVATDGVDRAIQALVETRSREGDVLQISADKNSRSLLVKYSVIDYRRSEFSQLQHRDGRIELIREKDGFVVRSTKSDYMDDIRDALIQELQGEAVQQLKRSEITLFHHLDHSKRSQFFFDLMTDLPGYTRKDVTDVFVYKAPPRGADDDEDAEPESHVERVLLRGNGVSRSELLRQLTKEKSYYIAKVGWIAIELMGRGFGFDIEVTFEDPKDCTGFSYTVRGVFELGENAKLSKHKRVPTPSEADAVAKAIESKARELLAKLDEDDDSANSLGG